MKVLYGMRPYYKRYPITKASDVNGLRLSYKQEYSSSKILNNNVRNGQQSYRSEYVKYDDSDNNDDDDEQPKRKK